MSWDRPDQGGLVAPDAGESTQSPTYIARVSAVGDIADLANGAPLVTNGVTLVADDIVLVWEQTDATENGLYRVLSPGTGADGQWVRAPNFDSDTEVETGALFYVREGTVYADNVFKLTTNLPITVGATALDFAPSLAGLITGVGASVPGNLPAYVDATGSSVTDSGAAASQVPSIAEKAALAGTDGVPSGTNRYVTDSDPRLATAGVLLVVFEAAGVYRASTQVGGRRYNRTSGAWTILDVTLHRETAGGSGSTILDVNVDGTSIYDVTPANRPTVSSGAGDDAVVQGGAPDTSSVPVGSYLSVDIDAVEAGGQNATLVITVSN